MWADNRLHAVLIRSLNPRYKTAIIEPKSEFGTHGDLTPLADNNPDKMRAGIPNRHEIDEFYASFRSLEFCFKNKGVPSVLPPRPNDLARGSNQPTSLVGCAQQSRKASL